MPTYEWDCQSCKVTWDHVCLTDARNEPQACPRCAAPGERNQVTRFSVDKTAAGSWNQQSYNPGLGCWTNSTKHGEQIAKRRGLEPIGNEPVEKLHAFYDKKREEKREERWSDDRVKLYE